ncbi:acyl-CoA synthetase [Xylanimonas allomyrinae]|uniref:Acyl-CoA synthetase n=1 Tax=Xylanimonas allomyrinae TaxID=2509459 RepID=A0A4P6EJ02_9MICO|nr:AMP-binding protein [Xylanimonas allomyrinae]QAY62285.1 acyl-CoA synthetase [Xylanimonas allomyrinae]
MYPGDHARSAPDRAALIMAGSGRTVTYRELDRRSRLLAGALADQGAAPGSTVLVALENDARWGEILWACLRSGLVIAPVNRHLGPAELEPLIADASPAVVVTSSALAAGVAAALARADHRAPCLVTDAGPHPLPGATDYEQAVTDATPIPAAHEVAGARLLFSSGTTGRPKAFRQPLPGVHPRRLPPRLGPLLSRLGFDAPDPVYLSTGPVYHAAPFAFLQTVHQLGGTVVVMERFDAAAALSAIERYRVTHSQWVPTMFVRLLRLPPSERARYDLSSHRAAVHAGAPCSPDVKEAMLDWWGPIVYEYYGASEGYGHTAIGPHEWREHRGSVGTAVTGRLHILDDDGAELPAGSVGGVWFEPPPAPEGPAPRASWGSAGDLGRLDEDGYLYLTGRAGQTIVSGGVNVYPREVEDVLITHPAVADVAVIGVPDEEFGESVRAVVQLAADRTADDALARDLIDLARARLAHFKCPRAVDFVDRLPRTPTGKLLLEPLRAAYRSAHEDRRPAWNCS